MVIACWGNPGSGTSTLAIKLALEFSNAEINTLLIDTNFIVPQLKIWYPKETIKPEQSLASILANPVELESVAGKILAVSEHLGVLGYGKDLAVNAIPTRDDTPASLLAVLEGLADVIIVDCTNITQDVLSFVALDEAEFKIIDMTADLRGLAWYESNVMMLREKWTTQKAKIIKIFNKVKVNSPVDSIEKAVGTVDYCLPHYEELIEEMYTGSLGQIKYRGRTKKYGDIIATLADEIRTALSAKTDKEIEVDDEIEMFDDTEEMPVIITSENSDTIEEISEVDELFSDDEDDFE